MPDAVEVPLTVIQGAFVDAAQVHPLVVVTVMFPAPPVAGTVALAGAST